MHTRSPFLPQCIVLQIVAVWPGDRRTRSQVAPRHRQGLTLIARNRNQLELFHFPLFRSLEARTLTTLHGRQDYPAIFLDSSWCRKRRSAITCRSTVRRPHYHRWPWWRKRESAAYYGFRPEEWRCYSARQSQPKRLAPDDGDRRGSKAGRARRLK